MEISIEKSEKDKEKRQFTHVQELVKMISNEEEFISKELKLSKEKYNELSNASKSMVLEDFLKYQPKKE